MVDASPATLTAAAERGDPPEGVIVGDPPEGVIVGDPPEGVIVGDLPEGVIVGDPPERADDALEVSHNDAFEGAAEVSSSWAASWVSRVASSLTPADLCALEIALHMSIDVGSNSASAGAGPARLTNGVMSRYSGKSKALEILARVFDRKS